MPKITPFLWFDNNAEEAARFYTSVFQEIKNGRSTPLWRCRAKAERLGDGRFVLH